MNTWQVTIELPDAVFQQLSDMAAATQQSVEALVTQSVVSNLPPTLEHTPLDLQAELLPLQRLDIEGLLAIAQATVAGEQVERHEGLLEKQREVGLTALEREKLAALRQLADRLMVRKAYAWAVLKWRGYRVPRIQ